MNRKSAHAGPRRPATEPAVPEPSHAERSRTLLHLGRAGTLATQSVKHPGYPFASVMPYALDADGRPIVLISAMAMHTQNLRAEPRSSLLVAQGSGEDLGAGRVTLLGDTRALAEEEVQAARTLYLKTHPRAGYWVDYADFAFYRLEVREIYFVGGFGVMGWVAAADYAAAAADPLAPSAAGILEHMNQDHAVALRLLARHLTEVDAEEATMTGVDRLGFRLSLRAAGAYQSHRIPFPTEVTSPEACRATLVAMVRDARAALGTQTAPDSTAESSG